MFRGLIIYAVYVASISAIVVTIAVAQDVPLETALGIFAIGVTGVLSIAVPVFALRHKPKRIKPRTDWQHLSADHVDRLPPTRAIAEIVAPPQPKEIDYARNVPQLSSPNIRLLSGPTTHRDRHTAD